MNQPLVSIICLCYNHARFLREALDSVLAQTYPRLEVIVVDDASTDHSVAIIQEYCARYAGITFVANAQNQGNCRAFNQGWRLAQGEYIIDFATDDVLLPHRVAEQVHQFQQLDGSYGVVYSDAELIDENSTKIGRFYRRLPHGELRPAPVSGYIYEQILRRYFISAPTMMIKRTVLEALQGYDETLAYEDFDFWVRSAKEYQYFFQNKVLTQRRLHARQLSRQLYLPHDQQLFSTVKVCQKAYALNESPAEHRALAIRIKYELKHAFLTGHFKEARLLIELLEKIQDLGVVNKLIKYGVFRRWKVPGPVYQVLVKVFPK